VGEVLLPKTEALNFQMYSGDLSRFFSDKTQDAPEVEKLTDKSREKIRQVMVRMFAEAGA
jgi:hypothetical protein